MNSAEANESENATLRRLLSQANERVDALVTENMGLRGTIDEALALMARAHVPLAAPDGKGGAREMTLPERVKVMALSYARVVGLVREMAECESTAGKLVGPDGRVVTAAEAEPSKKVAL